MSALPTLSAPKIDVTTKLVSSLKELIQSGELSPGCKLPPERELALRFGVSRPSLRQALKVLEIMGVLHQRVGDGTYLSSSAGAILSEPMEFLVLIDGISHLELFEARMIVEPELAARAAERATAEDITTLRKILVDMQSDLNDRKHTTECDVAFHDAIFRTAGNRVCRQMFGTINRSVLRSIQRGAQRADLDRVCRAHQAIYEAIASRDPEGARHQMAQHLKEARAVFLRETTEAATAASAAGATRSTKFKRK